MSNIKLGSTTYSNVDTIKVQDADNVGQYISFTEGGGSSIDEAVGKHVYVRWRFITDMQDYPTEPISLNFYNRANTLIHSETLTDAKLTELMETDSYYDFDFQYNSSVVSDYDNLYIEFVQGVNNWDEAIYYFDSVIYRCNADIRLNINSSSIQDRCSGVDFNNKSGYGSMMHLDNGSAGTKYEFMSLGHMTSGTSGWWSDTAGCFISGCSYYFYD